MKKADNNMIIRQGEKYGLIAIPKASIKSSFPDKVEITSQLWVTTVLPSDLDQDWRSWIGSIKSELLENSKIFLIAKGPSLNPDILNGENSQYLNLVESFYWGLLLTDFFKTGGTPIRLTGAYISSGVDIRQFALLDTVYTTPGTPVISIDEERIKQAADLVRTIEFFRKLHKSTRFSKIMHSFLIGLLADSVENRLHQFVRCIEGFIYPDIGETTHQFKSRTELFLGPKQHNRMGKMYKIRCDIEHLHDPFSSIQGSNYRNRLIELYRKSFEAEALARYCIRRLHRSPDIQQYFETDDALASFWKKELDERCMIWGDKIDIEKITASFDESLIKDE
jgi:hypothetical protein